MAEQTCVHCGKPRTGHGRFARCPDGVNQFEPVPPIPSTTAPRPCRHRTVQQGYVGDEGYVVACDECGEDLSSAPAPATPLGSAITNGTIGSVSDLVVMSAPAQEPQCEPKCARLGDLRSGLHYPSCPNYPANRNSPPEPSATPPIEFDREVDGRWIADMPSQPGVMAYGSTKEEAEANVRKLAPLETQKKVDEDVRVKAVKFLREEIIGYSSHTWMSELWYTMAKRMFAAEQRNRELEGALREIITLNTIGRVPHRHTLRKARELVYPKPATVPAQTKETP